MKFTILFAVLYFLFATQSVFAEGIGLGVYPPIIQINSVPPAEIQAPLTLENRSEIPLDIKIELKPFVSSDRENGQIKYIEEKEANFADPDIFNKVKIYDLGNQLTGFSIAPKQRKDLTLRISLPKDSKESDYYFSIIFLASSGQEQSSSTSQSVSGIASNVLLSVGEGKTTGSVQEFSAPFFVEKAPVPFTVRIKNTSNHFVAPKGEIIIKNIFDKPIGRVDLLETNILSQSVRNIPSSDFANEDTISPEKEITADWKNNFIIGPYKATLTLALSDKGPIFRRTIFFFAFPAKAVLALILGMLTVLFVIGRVRSKV